MMVSAKILFSNKVTFTDTGIGTSTYHFEGGTIAQFTLPWHHYDTLEALH